MSNLEPFHDPIRTKPKGPLPSKKLVKVIFNMGQLGREYLSTPMPYCPYPLSAPAMQHFHTSD